MSTSPFMKKMNVPTSQEDVNVTVIGAVIAVVFITLCSVVVLIVIYLYKNKGSYHTYERPEADPEGSVQMEDLSDPCVLPMDEGACKQYTVLWYFHQEANHCRPFIFGGCGGNANQFPSKKKCELWCKRTTDPFEDVDQIQGERDGEKKQVSTISKTIHAPDGMV